MEQGKMVLSITELANELGITYQGAKKKLLNNRNELKEYLFLDNKKNIKGISIEGLEALRNLPHRTTTASKLEAENSKQAKKIEQATKGYEELVKELRADKERLLNEKEILQAKITSLEAELNSYRDANLFTRLLGYKKR